MKIPEKYYRWKIEGLYRLPLCDWVWLGYNDRIKTKRIEVSATLNEARDISLELCTRANSNEGTIIREFKQGTEFWLTVYVDNGVFDTVRCFLMDNVDTRESARGEIAYVLRLTDTLGILKQLEHLDKDGHLRLAGLLEDLIMDIKNEDGTRTLITTSSANPELKFKAEKGDVFGSISRMFGKSIDEYSELPAPNYYFYCYDALVGKRRKSFLKVLKADWKKKLIRPNNIYRMDETNLKDATIKKLDTKPSTLVYKDGKFIKVFPHWESRLGKASFKDTERHSYALTKMITLINKEPLIEISTSEPLPYSLGDYLDISVASIGLNEQGYITTRSYSLSTTEFSQTFTLNQRHKTLLETLKRI